MQTVLRYTEDQDYRRIVVAEKDNNCFMFNEKVHVSEVYTLAAAIQSASKCINMDEWHPVMWVNSMKEYIPMHHIPIVEQGTAQISHTQFLSNVQDMIKKLEDTNIKEAKPSLNKADAKKIKEFKNTGKYAAHVRSAHWCQGSIRKGAIINSFKIPEGKEKNTLFEAFAKYDSVVTADVKKGKYGKNVKIISYSEWLEMI